MGISYENEEFRVYSPRSFDEEESYEPGYEPIYDDAFYYDSDDDEDDDVFVPTETSFSEIESRAALREIEKKVNYDAIENDDNEGLYKSMSEVDIEIVIGFGQHLRRYGVIEDQGYVIESSTEISSEELFAGASAAAMTDEEINPDVYSSEYEEVIQEALTYEESHNNDDEMMSLEYSNQEYARFTSGDEEFIYSEEETEDEADLLDIYGEEEDEEEPVNNAISVSSMSFSYTEEYEDEEVEEEVTPDLRRKGAGFLSPDDVLLLIRMFTVNKLTDQDISGIITGLTVEDVAKLRAELGR